MQTLSWIATCLSISGNIGVNYKKVWGMWVWFFGGLLWIIYALLTKNYAQLTMFSVYTCLNVHGIIKWSKIKGGDYNSKTIF